MTDEEYMFHTDCAEKKKTATGAYHKKTKGGRVMMPSDYLSKKEREKMNSEVTTYKLGEPCTWDEFLRMPFDTKREYLESLYSKYNPTLSAMSQMFGVTPPALCKAIKNMNLPKSGCTRKRTSEEIEAWERFIGKKTDVLDIEPKGHPDPVGETGAPGVFDASLSRFSTIDPKSGTVTFHGTVDDVLIAVRRLFAGNPDVELTAIWEVSDD